MILTSEIKEELRHLSVRIDIALRQRIGNACVVLSVNGKDIEVRYTNGLVCNVLGCDEKELVSNIEDKVAILEAFDLKYPIGKHFSCNQ